MTTVNDLKGQTVAFAASGGLDSCTVTKWLTENGVKVVCFTADIAQPDEANFDEVGTRMKAPPRSTSRAASGSPRPRPPRRPTRG